MNGGIIDNDSFIADTRSGWTIAGQDPLTFIDMRLAGGVGLFGCLCVDPHRSGRGEC